jgi:ADP-heptose:LPS heptosyltransferase
MSESFRAVVPRSLLVIKPSSLGDIVHGLQILQGVARQLPDCRITWVARDRFAPLVEAAPFIHEVIHFRRKEGLRGLWEVLKTLRGRSFDEVWDMQGLLRSGLMAAAARAPRKWGRRDSREAAGLFYTDRIALPAGEGPHHAIRILQGFPLALGLAAEVIFPLELDPGPVFPWAAFFQGDPNLQFVVFTDSRGPGKEWPAFDALTRLIWQQLPGSRVAWCAGQPAAPGGSPPAGRFLNLTGCPFDEMIALCRQPAVFIGNDSGPMHLSAAAGNKVLAIFGPTSPLRFGPWPIGSPRTRAIQAPGGVLAELTAEAVMACLLDLCGVG